MSPTPQDVQAKIADAETLVRSAKETLLGTSSSGSAFVKSHGDVQTAWPATAKWTTGYSALDAALSRLDAASVEAGQLVVPTPPPPPPPPPPAGTGLALTAYGSTLKNHTHLTDGTYDVVVADWADAALLAIISGKGFAYTITTSAKWGGTGPNPANYVILDPLGNSGLTGALKPDDYIAKCAALKAAHPGLHGIFLDNNVALGHNLLPSVPEATLLPILAHVSAGLKAHGLRWLSNTGSYISGDPRSNDGSLWRLWAQAIAPYFEYMLFENWQQASSETPPVRRLRGTDAWYKHWDDFQKCVGAVPGQFMGASYEFGGDKMFGIYGRASMLTAPGADPRNVFHSAVDYKTDPYGDPWQKRNPIAHVDPVAGTAAL